jgi:hypothetical protein
MLMHPLPSPDELSSHSIKTGKGAYQVAGYPPEGVGIIVEAPEVSSLSHRGRAREGVVEYPQNFLR